MVYLSYYIRKWVLFLEEKTKGKINKKDFVRALRILFVLAVILGGIGWIQYLQVREFKFYDTKSESELYTNPVGCEAGEEKLFVYSNDGARALDSSGNAVWEIAYQLDNPDVAYCEDVAAVADIGGTSVYVVAENGIPYNYEVIYPIIKHEVAKQGVTVVLLDNGTEDFIRMYDINGTLRVDINTKTKVDGIPIDIALSPDGKKLVTLYVTFQGNAMICKTTFYNADEVGKNYINNIVGQRSFAENLLAYDVCFLNEDTVCVLLENGFALYRMTETPELICEKTITETIEQMLCTEKGIYLVRETADKQRTLSFFDTKGKEKQVLKEVPEYESIAATEEEIVFFSPQRVTAYRANGSVKFSAAFAQSLEAVYPAGGNRYFLVNAGKVQTIKLTNKTSKEEKKSSARISGRAFCSAKQGGLK